MDKPRDNVNPSASSGAGTERPSSRAGAGRTGPAPWASAGAVSKMLADRERMTRPPVGSLLASFRFDPLGLTTVRSLSRELAGIDVARRTLAAVLGAPIVPPPRCVPLDVAAATSLSRIVRPSWPRSATAGSMMLPSARATSRRRAFDGSSETRRLAKIATGPGVRLDSALLASTSLSRQLVGIDVARRTLADLLGAPIVPPPMYVPRDVAAATALSRIVGPSRPRSAKAGSVLGSTELLARAIRAAALPSLDGLTPGRGAGSGASVPRVVLPTDEEVAVATAGSLETSPTEASWPAWGLQLPSEIRSGVIGWVIGLLVQESFAPNITAGLSIELRFIVLASALHLVRQLSQGRR